MLCRSIVVISEYCKGNSSAVEYPLGLKLIRLHIKDVSFTTDQTERHLEVGAPVIKVMILQPKDVYWCRLGYFSTSIIRKAYLVRSQPVSLCFRPNGGAAYGLTLCTK
ncbi:hypothetical protein Adt_06566 [Abeliophyllum distichum]|uniref:Uncharacterized protein n=1 Tax=Abeliophyllum distichum TaxID=126358 RepID=A0ABD1RXF8_9LAMI